MALPVTVEQFHGVFRDYDIAVWPVQRFLVALAALSIAGAGAFIGQGAIQRRLTVRWVPGPGATAVGALIVFALRATAGRQLRTRKP